jgi:divalent metal cation (Fe/Co/Zn/Cd) transporter
MASIHAEVPNNVDIERSHEIIDRIEKDAMTALGMFLVIHMDPIAVDDPQVAHYRSVVSDVIRSMDQRCTVHDFRMVKGERRTNLIFDLVVPREWPVDQDEKLTQKVNRLVQEQEPQCVCVITVERSFVAVSKEVSNE